MININGSLGGGQILRTSLALSAITGKCFKMKNIRENRSNSGLRPQHLAGVKTISDLTGAKVKGAKIGSKEIKFEPKTLNQAKVVGNIETAGSTGLVLQTLSLPASQVGKKVEIEINGGSTFSKWSPPINYLKEILNKVTARLGFQSEVKTVKHGFYPQGGAEIRNIISPWTNKKSLLWENKGNLKEINGISIASESLRKANVAVRQKKSSKKVLKEEFDTEKLKIDHKYVKSDSPGSGIVLWAVFERGIIGANQIGEKGKPSERIGGTAAKELLSQINTDASLDKYLGDQILPYLALIKDKSVIKVPEISDHIKTNLKVIKKFLSIKKEVKDKKIMIKPN